MNEAVRATEQPPSAPLAKGGKEEAQPTNNKTIPIDNKSSSMRLLDGKRTVGEELFLVHIARHKGEAPSEDDYDRVRGPRERSRSIGEELWGVHLRRSIGMEPDVDNEWNISKPTDKKPTKAGKKTSAKPKKGVRCSPKVMHLRNRDVKMMIS